MEGWRGERGEVCVPGTPLLQRAVTSPQLSPLSDLT